MGFIDNTRLKFNQLTPMVKAVGGGTVIQELPKVGILAYLLVPVTFTVTGTLSAPNAFGFASIINRITLRVNAGHAIFDVSGAGYHWLVRDMLETHLQDFGSYTNARAAVTATTGRLDFFIPVAMNMRDETGLLMLQNEQTLVTLAITYELDATVATGATVVATASPVMAFFEVPEKEEDLPNLRVVHQIIEDQLSVAATGQFQHNPPRDAVITALYYLTPTWTAVQTVIQQSNTIEDWTPNSHQMRYMLTTGRDTALAGGAIVGNDRRFMLDMAGTDGLGEFWTMRDVLDTGRLTNFFNRFTFSATGTMLAVRRQVFPLAPPAGG